MANMRDIRRRIKSVVSTQKITKAMKMVSAAKLRKTQSTLVAVRPYSDKIQEVMNHLLGGGDDYNSPFLQPRDEVKKYFCILWWPATAGCAAATISTCCGLRKIS